MTNMKNRTIPKNRKKGFSLVELVVVMAIIGILMVALAPNYKGFIKSAQNTAVQADAKSLSTMIDLYNIRNTTGITDPTLVSDLSTTLTGNTTTEAVTITEFLGDLSGKNSPLLTAKVGDLGTIVKGDLTSLTPVTP